jgi:hypothetical protein
MFSESPKRLRNLIDVANERIANLERHMDALLLALELTVVGQPRIAVVKKRPNE